jgi:glutathione S-transferase
MSRLRILGKASSINVRKVLWTCREIGRDYIREDWGSGFSATDTPEFLALNPNGQVPVIVDETGALWESNTICRYLAAEAGRKDLLPDAPRARALVERWMDWQATDLNSSWRYAFLALARRNPAYADPAQIAASTEQWNRAMGILDRQLASTGAHVLGPGFTLADVVLGLSVHRWIKTPLPERPALPAVARYYDLLSERPAYREFGRDGVA